MGFGRIVTTGLSFRRGPGLRPRATLAALLGATLAAAACSGAADSILAPDSRPDASATDGSSSGGDGGALPDGGYTHVPEAQPREDAQADAHGTSYLDAPATLDAPAMLDASPDGVALPMDSSPMDVSEASTPADASFVCPPAVDPSANWLYQQPGPQEWHDNFGGGASTFMACDFIAACPAPQYSDCCPSTNSTCGSPATHWTQSGVPVPNWIYVPVDDSPLNANLQSGQVYTAQISVTGSASGIVFFLDVWDGNADEATAPEPLVPGTVTTFSKSFTAGTGNNPQIQLRWEAAGSSLTSVDMDIEMFNLSIQ